MKNIYLLTIFYLFNFTVYSQIVINEYSCSNVNGDSDAFNQKEDWFELYNTTQTDYNIGGFYFTDKASNLTKYEIPSVVISANSYLRVYCSGRNTIQNGEIHTNFKLTQTKNEKIIFSDNSGNIIDSLTINFVTQNDHSYGRTNDGSNSWSLFTTPTPNATNTGAKNYYTNKPILSIEAGVYPEPQTVSLSTPDANASIFYTLDGSTPTQSSTQYTTPINISNTSVLRARSFSSNTQTPPSFIETNTYFIGTNHTLPIISIVGQELNNLLNGFQIEPQGSFEFFDADGTLKDEAVGEFNKHGNDSWAYDQRGFDFKVRDQFGYNYAIKHKIFSEKSREEFQKLIVKAAANDNASFETGGAHIRDAYVHTLSQIGKLRVDERTSAFCILYKNGEYWGVYDVREKVDDHDFTSYYYDQNERNIDFLKTWGQTWVEYGTRDDWDDLKAYILNNDVTDPAIYQQIKSRYNVGSLIDYVVLNSFIVSSDWLNWNTAWWRGKNPEGDKKKYRYILWDMDATFDHYKNFTGIEDQSANADPCNPENLDENSDPESHIAILNKLAQNETFKQEYISRYIDLSNDILSCERLLEVLDSMVNVIEPEMPAQFNKWGGLMQIWSTNVQKIRDFLNERCETIKEGLKDCYDLEGPFKLTVDVEPENAGKVKINSLTINEYVYTGEYYGGIAILLKAKAKDGYEFDYWEISNHELSPSINEDTVTLQNITEEDKIIAHFKEKDTSTTTDPDPTPDPDPDPDPVVNDFSGVFIPNAFSPDGNGQNDLLEIFTGKDVAQFNFRLIDRWGQVIWSTSTKGDSFNGMVRGKALNSGVYAYMIDIKYNDGKPNELKSGNVTLVR